MRINMQKKHLLSITILGISLCGLTACNDADDKNSYISYEYYQSEKSYSAGKLPDNASRIEVMTYKMPYVSGKQQSATAMVIFPKISQPKDGWRVVVWAHGTTGVGDTCAPSQNLLGTNFQILANSLLQKGYVIVAPDYEGLGKEGIHPYLNLESEAQSAIYAIKAVKEKYRSQLHDTWMSIGQSQGGHASLGIAEYADQDKNYKGAVATAPASSLGYIISQIAPTAIANIEQINQDLAIAVYAELLSYAAYTVVGIKAYEPNFDYAQVFNTRSYKIAVNAEGTTGDNGLCLTDMMDKYSTDIKEYLSQNPNSKIMQYPGLKDDFAINPTVKTFLDNSQPGTKKLNKPVYVVQGKLDSAVPYQVTEGLVDRLNLLGTQPKVQLDLVEGASHTQAIVIRNVEVVNFIQKYMPAS